MIIPTIMQKTAIGFLSLLLVLPQVTADRKKEIFTSARCPPVAEGDYGAITFFSERPVNSSTELIFYVKRDDGPDLVSCHLKAEESTADCETFNESFKAEGMVRGNLTIVILNATKDHQGKYVLHVFSKELYHNPIACQFNILEGGDNTKQRDTGRDKAPIMTALIGTIAIVLCLICVICVVIRRHRILVFLNLKRKRFKRERQKEPTLREEKSCSGSCPDSGNSLKDEETSALIAKDNNIQEAAVVHGEKDESTDWEAMKEEDNRLLLREGPGSFLIRNNPKDQTYDRLAVNYNGKEELFAIRKEENRVVLEATGMSFKSLSDLVRYYTENEIRTSKGHAYCKLTKDIRHDLQAEGSQVQKEHQQKQVESGSLHLDSTHFAVDSTCATSKNAHSVEDVSTDNNMSSGIAGRIQTIPRQVEPQTTDRPVSPMSPSSQEAACALTPTTDVHSEEDPYSDSSIPRQEETPTTDRPVTPMSPHDQEAACALTSATDDYSEEDLYSDSSIGYLEDVQSRTADRKLLRDNGRGSFFVRPSDRGPHKVLAVNFYGDFHYFTIAQEGANFVLKETGETFTSPRKLIEYYKEKAIKTVEGKSFGTLSLPCTKNKEKGPKTKAAPDKKHPASWAGQKGAPQVFQATDDEHCDKDLTTGSKTLKTSADPIQCEMKGNTTSSDATRLEQLVNIHTVTPNKSSTPRESSV